jgi:predicted ribosomally synthesized peptide with SipW-like signal peptide
MSLRKTAGLLAAFGLMVGLIGGGVGAVFTDQVTADETINVGTFECLIVAPSDGIIAGDAKSVSYTAPTIMSSAPGSAPFDFTVKNTGSIPAYLTVTVSPVGAPFSVIGAPFAAVPLGSLATHTYATGIAWGALSSVNEGTSGTVTWTVTCAELPPNDPMASTNAANIAHVPQWANFTATPGAGAVALTFNQPRAHYACFEYRTDGDMGQMISATNYNAGIHDGLYPYECLNVAGSSVVVNVGPTIGYVEVRMVFGGEADERFDWTRVDAL